MVVCQDVVEVSSTRWRSPWVNLRRSLLYLFVVRMFRLRRDSLTLVVIFMCPHVVSQRSPDVCVEPEESWIHWIMGCGAVGTCAGR